MSRLTRDGTAEPVLRDQILRRERGQGDINFSFQLTTTRIGNLTRLIPTLAVCVTIHAYYTYYMHAIIILLIFVYDEVVTDKRHDEKEHDLLCIILLYYVLYILRRAAT